MPTSPGPKKKSTKGQQVRPLIVSAARSRVTQEVAMSAATWRELMGYARWAAQAAGMTLEEATILTLDRAVGDLLRKDELWQQVRTRNGAEVAAPAPAPAPPPSGPALPSTGRQS